AFRKSEQPDDWRSLMSLYMVRRTRTYIRRNYARRDVETGRFYLEMSGNNRFYMPDRVPVSEHFAVDSADPADQYAALYSDNVVALVNDLHLPRYGLQEYRRAKPPRKPSAEETRILDDLGRAGRRLMGFSRTNLFKRLESSGQAFILSVERHILRNYIFLYAIEHGLPLPIGTQGAQLLRLDVTLDSRYEDEDPDDPDYTAEDLLDDDTSREEFADKAAPPREQSWSAAAFRKQAEGIYTEYAGPLKRRFRWIAPEFFEPGLARDLAADAEALIALLVSVGPWRPQTDRKLEALERLLKVTYPRDKVLIFSQFADTVEYVSRNLCSRGVARLAGVTGQSADPTDLARRFSPRSNDLAGRLAAQEELRVLVATDVLSEGQNLQDAHIVVNYDLPWAIIRLIQRAGRVDRIGQGAPEILCHSFWPTDGVERLLRLRARLRQRLRENAEVVGSDEVYFEDEANPDGFIDLYAGKAGSLDERDEGEVDLVSEADAIWRRAIEQDPSLEKQVTGLPPVVYATKGWTPSLGGPEGALVYVQTASGNAALGWARPNGDLHSASTLAVLRAAECSPDTPALERAGWHHEAVGKVAAELARGAATLGGGLGSTRGARYKAYVRLEKHARALRQTLFGRTDEAETLYRAIDQIFRFPLQSGAVEHINRQLNAQARDEDLAELVKSLYEDGRLCQVEEDGGDQSPPVIICSMGLSAQQ
ncbi:MAG: SWF/SNF helicase family protein, partial [Anaerolineales bacterium]|nr:SWF/SNF helicase family protein [Anaerolineales bacterium]